MGYCLKICHYGVLFLQLVPLASRLKGYMAGLWRISERWAVVSRPDSDLTRSSFKVLSDPLFEWMDLTPFH